jgi:hypothetical protein
VKIKIYKNFLNKEECQQLTDFALKLVENKTLAVNSCAGRYSGRYIRTIKLPELAKQLNKKVREVAKISQYPVAVDRGVEGVNIVVTVEEGRLPRHLDARSGDRATYRCNVITQKSDIGGELVIEGEKVNLEEGDLHCYLTSEVVHEVTPSAGKPRVLWMFGAWIPLNETQNFL